MKKPFTKLQPIIAGLTLIATTAFAANRPNILVIVSDDQGYAEAGFQGYKDIPTPQLVPPAFPGRSGHGTSPAEP